MMNGVERPPLTDRQAEILVFIRRSHRERGYPPTLREIGKQFGISSPNGVQCHIKAMIAKGYLAHEENLSRGLRVIEEPIDVTQPESRANRLARLKREAFEAMDRYRAALVEDTHET